MTIGKAFIQRAQSATSIVLKISKNLSMSPAFVRKERGLTDNHCLVKTKERKVRASQSNTGGNAPPLKDEEQWNRKNIRGYDPRVGNGRLKGSWRSENSQTLCEARSNREARVFVKKNSKNGSFLAFGSDRLSHTVMGGLEE